MSSFQPPPTWALPILVDERTSLAIFNPVWLKWFVDLTAALPASGAGSVSSVSVVSANGLAGTVATATTTPAITLSTTVTGLLKGNGTAISAAVSGTDYAPATSGTSILYGNGAGGFSNVTIGTGVAFAAGTLSATGSGGTVTSVTGTAPVVSSGGTTPAISMAAATTSVNGYLTSTDWTTFNNKGSGTVTSVTGTAGRITSTGGTTPVIDLASGVATAGTTGSVSLIPVVTIDTYGRVTGITTAANPQGTVTSVTGTSPVASSGGATPAISMPAATTSVNGYLTSTDWTTFNNKGSGTVTSVTGTAPVVSSGGAAPAISMAAATASVNGYLTSTDWTIFNSKQAAGSYLVSGGALGTPSSGTVTNLTGTASININGTVGATTANTGAFTTISASGVATIGPGSTLLTVNTASGSAFATILGTPGGTVFTFQRNDEAGFAGRIGAGNSLYGPGAVRSFGVDGFSEVNLGINGTRYVQLTASALTVTPNASFSGTLTPGQTTGIVGTTTNNNAQAGSVGEVISSSVAVGSAVSLTNAVSAVSGKTITSISLTAGDWDVYGVVGINMAATTNFTASAGGISTTNDTLNGLYEEETRFAYGAAGLVPANVFSFAIPTTRVSIASTTTYYLIGYASFSVSTATAFGRITARRVR